MGRNELQAQADALAAAATDLANKLRAYEPAPADPFSPVSYARFLHAVDDKVPLDVQVARWHIQALQGDQWHLSQLAYLKAHSGTLTLRCAATIVRRRGDALGASQCLPPSQIPDAWMLRRNGRIISRVRDGDEFVNVANVDYQRAAAAFLVQTCVREGWDGVWFDEFNADPKWSFADATTTPEQHQAALRSFILAVAPALRAAGLQVWINLAGNYGDSWTQGMVQITDGHTVEYYIARGPEPTASVENGYFRSTLDWTEWCEKLGKPGIYHAQTMDDRLAHYALATYLLATEGHGSFGASVDPYPPGGDLFTPTMDAARKLGRPQGARRTLSSGVYVRDFEYGQVQVNPYERAVDGLPPRSAVIASRAGA